MCTKSFTMENDMPMDSLNASLKDFFVNVSPSEVFFSAAFSFFEKDTTVDLWEKLVADISSMHAFIRTMSPEADIMPAILIIYDDDTYDLDAFHADIKTTVYRKISEVSQKYLKELRRKIFAKFVSCHYIHILTICKTFLKRQKKDLR